MTNLFKKIGGHIREKYMYYICGIITLGLLILGIFNFPNAIGRLVESFRDFGLSVAYTTCEWVGIETDITPTVNALPDYSFLNVKDWFSSLFKKPSLPSSPSVPSAPLPSNWEQFKAKWSLYWATFADSVNVILYLYYLLYILSWVAPVFMLFIPAWIGIKKIFNKYYFKEPKTPETEEEQKDETLPIRESVFLQIWHWIYFKIIVRILLWCISFIDFIKEREELCQFWLFLVLLYFNAFTIAIEFLAYYVYFMSSMDFINLYRQIYKLFLDLKAVIPFIGIIGWLVIGYLLLDRYAKNIAYERLEREVRKMEEYLSGV